MKIKTLIVEDEIIATKHLVKMLTSLPQAFEILHTVTSIQDAVHWLENNDMPQLIFMDIHLSDGNSFDIIAQTTITCPIIFITAYDQYAIQAFKTTGIDYLLKPISEEDVALAIQKFLNQKKEPTIDWLIKNTDVLHHLTPQNTTDYKQRFLLKSGKKHIPVHIDQVAYFYRDDLVFVTLFDGTSYIIDESLEQIHKTIDPTHFIRLHRKIIVHTTAIKSLKTYKPGRFIVELQPPFSEPIYLSQERSSWIRTYYK
jgi:DNA-binding LytR/AlgR family response regulator